ncbi:hypothetical protein [Shewanella cyperi]|uniref:Uncharacterized protein n=2 Tax=Shewanella sedimentimangrovi TaxID=2814293 RepID=A0ABX7R5I6_9GAMM|nr:hypothetical protein [Shewanella cyperi]QSX39136.1 hypothetical protein JYB85_14295 [Shewanella sedimentimangrovi]QSX40056.1 hypothetical protein JYB84_13880 [Shewanella cyperi]
MSNMLKAIGVMAALGFGQSAFAADMVCNLNVKSGGYVDGNGTAHCIGFDYSFGSSTSGTYSIENVTKPISSVIWSGNAKCSGGVSCGVTVRAYSINKASATILYKDGTWEQTNTANMSYETGY